MSDTDTSLIQEKLLSRINEKMNLLNSLRPLPADAVNNLHEEMRLLHTYHSNAIEGNTLTLQETKLVLEEAGKYRTKNVRITGAVKTPPDWSKVIKLMDELIEKVAQYKKHPV
jgi:Fic family protein